MSLYPFQSLLTWQDIAQDPTLIDDSILHYIETEPTKRSIVLTEPAMVRSRSMELELILKTQHTAKDILNGTAINSRFGVI
jgi:hypothetical protein